MSKCADCKSVIDIEASLVCSVCEEARLIADRDEWKARANKFEAQVEMLETRAEADLINAEAAIARATQAEAQAAALLGAMEDLSDGACDAPGYSSGCDLRCRAVAYRALDTYGAIGRTLLAELEALRKLETEVRDSLHYLSDRSCIGCSSALAKDNLETELRAVDAARKGET